jgi:competence protein ComEC
VKARRGLGLGDRAAVVAAIVVVGGAWFAWPVSPWLVALAASLALALRHPVVVIVTLGLLASCLAARAWAGLHAPDARTVQGTATLVSDPMQANGAVHAEVRLDGRHFDAWARGPGAGVLARRLAGERVDLSASVSRGSLPGWLTSRHVVSRLQVDRVIPLDDGNVLARTANSIRRVLVRGAEPLGQDRRTLFTGLVIGDDREQPIEITDDFLGAGLSHLLAVSGQNVAFVLAAASPLLRRLGLRTRVIATVGLLILFATVTRYEPSVLRATVMAGLACLAFSLGRRGPTVRLLLVTVVVLVLVDPFLVRSVGFGLSVAASAGILVLSRPLAAAMPGPETLRQPLAVVLAAQVGVAPLLLAVFGGLPVASLPANLLAEPVAGLVMMWGATVGLLAGLVPKGLATLFHLPTMVGLWWIASVARWSADARLGQLGVTGMMAAVGLGAAALRARVRHRCLGRSLAVALLAVLLWPAVIIRQAGPPDQFVDGAGTLRRTPDGTVLTVAADARPASALRALRARGVVHLDVVELPRGSAMEAVAAVIGRRIPVERVVTDRAETAETESSG